MNNNFTNEFEIIKKQVEAIHDLTVTTCDVCGGTYVENLDSAESHFTLGGERFKIIVKKI